MAFFIVTVNVLIQLFNNILFCYLLIIVFIFIYKLTYCLIGICTNSLNTFINIKTYSITINYETFVQNHCGSYFRLRAMELLQPRLNCRQN
jgi:hypothetical protein